MIELRRKGGGERKREIHSGEVKKGKIQEGVVRGE